MSFSKSEHDFVFGIRQHVLVFLILSQRWVRVTSSSALTTRLPALTHAYTCTHSHKEPEPQKVTSNCFNEIHEGSCDRKKQFCCLFVFFLLFFLTDLVMQNKGLVHTTLDLFAHTN